MALALTLIATFMPAVIADGDYATGLIWDSPEIIEAHLLEMPVTEDALPSSVDLTDKFPAPGNQGSQNSCVAWAVAYALKSHQEELSRNWGLDTDEHLFSPAYIYNQCCGGTDSGTSVYSVMELIVNQGVCTLASFPYNDSDYLTQPTEEQTAEAEFFKAEKWYAIRGNDSIKQRLADGDGVIISLTVYPDFRNISPDNPVFDDASGSRNGSHTVCLIGYDDEIGAFKFINSWGTNWGLDGYGWISYDMLNTAGVNSYEIATGFVMDPCDSIFTQDFFNYIIHDGEAEIIDYSGAGGEVVIPDMLGGYPVTKIGRGAFQGNALITGAVIPDSVTSIGNNAFLACSSLTGIVIPDSVIEIGDSAFASCSSLTSAAIGKNVAVIGSRSFVPCTALQEFVVSADNPSYTEIDGVLFDKQTKTLIQYPGGRTGTYEIPDVATAIGEFAFFDNDNISCVVIPGSVSTIGGFAFTSCEELTEVIISDGVTFIDDSAFSICFRLTKITIPDSVTYIDSYAFFFDDNLTIHCNRNSYAHKYAADWGLPFSVQLEVSPLPDTGNSLVNYITMARTSDNVYNFTADCEATDDVFFVLATYDGDLMTKAYIANSSGEIRQVPEKDLINSKIFIWDKNMRPRIKAIKL